MPDPTPDELAAYHETHGRMSGKGACSWVRRGDEHCDAWHLATALRDEQARVARVEVVHARRILARHFRVLASAVNIKDWPAYIRFCADKHDSGEAWLDEEMLHDPHPHGSDCCVVDTPREA